MRYVLTVLASFALFGATASAQAPASAPPTHSVPMAPSIAIAPTAPVAARPAITPMPLALTMLPAKSGAKLNVASPAFKDGAAIPTANTTYGANIFPGLAWSGAPKGAKSFAVIVQDTDPPAPYAAIQTILHWLMFDVPARVTKLAPGAAAPPPGAVDGANMMGRASFYRGPHPPAGGPVHHYHFQVFALDETISLPAGAKFADVTAAMDGHVLASGETVGTYQGPAKP